MEISVKKLLEGLVLCIIVFMVNLCYRIDVTADELNFQVSDDEVFVFLNDENGEEIEENNYILRSIEQPTTKYETNQWVSINGSVTNGFLYSNGYFTNVYKITLIITNNANTDMTFILANPSDAGNFKTCDEQTIEAKSSKTIYYNNLKTNRKYFFVVQNSEDFSGRALGFEMGEE